MLLLNTNISKQLVKFHRVLGRLTHIIRVAAMSVTIYKQIKRFVLLRLALARA